MNNVRSINYIGKRLKERFGEASLVKTLNCNENNGSFSAKYGVGNILISFVRDRGYLEVQILRGTNYTSLNSLDPSFRNLRFNEENIEMILDYIDDNNIIMKN
jgi:hypothetical protein